jgi:ribonuclease Z
MRKRLVLGLIVLAVAGVAYLQRDAVQMALFTRAVDKQMGRNALAALDPKHLHVAFCGTGSPLPSRDRAEACTAVIAGGRMFIFDAGEGAGKTLAMMGLPLGATEGVWLTHLHSDHFEGLGALMLQRWAGASATTPLTVYGPEGVGEVTEGLTRAFRLDSGYRVAHHGADIVPPTGFGLVGKPLATPGLVYDENGVRITAFAVNHAPVSPAFGYRLDWQGKSVTISGDTAASPALVQAAKGTDLLVHEVLSARMVAQMQAAATRTGQPKRAKILGDIPGYHATPEQAGQAARIAGAKALALTHIVPSVPGLFDGLFTRPAETAFDGPTLLMRDGDVVSIGDKGTRERRNLLP